MSKIWLNIVGIGEDGVDGLSPTARAAINSSDILIGGARHHALTDTIKVERLTWPSPFDAMIETIEKLRGKQVCVLVTGDPGWFSAGVKIASQFKSDEVCVHPHVSAFQLAASRMDWALQDTVTLTVHGRPIQTIVPDIAPGALLLLLTRDPETHAQIASQQEQQVLGHNRITA